MTKAQKAEPKVDDLVNEPDEPDEATSGGGGDGAGTEGDSEMVPKPKAKVSRPAEDGSSDECEEYSKGKSRRAAAPTRRRRSR